MTDPIPINLASIETKAGAAQEARTLIARQLESANTLKETLAEGANPAAAERRQARFRPLENRSRPAPSDTRRIEAVEKRSEEDLAHDFERRNPELPAGRLVNFRRNLRPDTTAEQLLDDVMDTFGDPTLADEAMEYLERTTDGPLQEAVKQARAALFSEKGREIIAGRNIDAAAKLFAQKGLAETPTDLRNLYREITGNPRDHNTLFTELSNEYPFDQLQMVVAFLLKGLGFDLKSKGPSIQSAELMRLMTEVRNMQSILWIYLFFKGRMRLVNSLFSKYGGKLKETLTFEKLAKEFIKIVEEKYPSVLKLLKQTDNLDLDDLGKIIILLQFRDAIRGLPPRIYRSTDHRNNLLLIILDALDELEAEEEDEGS